MDVSETKPATVRVYAVQCDICGAVVKNPGHPVFDRRKCDLCGKDLCSSAKCGESVMYEDKDGDIAALRFCVSCLEVRKPEVEKILQELLE